MESTKPITTTSLARSDGTTTVVSLPNMTVITEKSQDGERVTVFHADGSKRTYFHSHKPH